MSFDARVEAIAWLMHSWKHHDPPHDACGGISEVCLTEVLERAYAAGVADFRGPMSDKFDARSETQRLDDECAILYIYGWQMHTPFEKRAAVLQRFLERAYAAGAASVHVSDSGDGKSGEQ